MGQVQQLISRSFQYAVSNAADSSTEISKEHIRRRGGAGEGAEQHQRQRQGK